MDNNLKSKEATERKNDETQAGNNSNTAETKEAGKKNNEPLLTEASQKGKSVDRDITDPATEPEE